MNNFLIYGIVMSVLGFYILLDAYGYLKNRVGAFEYMLKFSLVKDIFNETYFQRQQIL